VIHPYCKTTYIYI